LRRFAALASSALLILTACSFGVLPTSALLGTEMSIEREMEMTANIHRQIRAQTEFVSDPVLLAYVNDIGQRIVKVTGPQPFIFRFNIFKSQELNAFTIGGGYVYLSSEVMAEAGDVSELAGVLAHEITHVRLRHIAKKQEGQGVSTLATLAALAILVAGGQPEMAIAAQGINVSMQLKNSRAHEAEADREGIAYMIRAGYDPKGMPRFFMRILAKNPNSAKGVPPYLYSHPALKERIADTQAQLRHMKPPAGLPQNNNRLQSMQNRLALLRSPVPGGSGLMSRAPFAREITDPLLKRAKALREKGDDKAADAILIQAQKLQPGDPRVALLRADIAEQSDDLDLSCRQLQRAFEIDPSVPLVLYRLGRVHRKLGNRTRAVFYLEQAAMRFRPGSAGRRRAELEAERISFPVFESVGLTVASDEHAGDSVVRGEPVVWQAKLSPRFQTYNPEVRVTWTDPEGKVAQLDSVRMGALGNVSAQLSTRTVPLGQWTVKVRISGELVDSRSFRVIEQTKPASESRTRPALDARKQSA